MNEIHNDVKLTYQWQNNEFPKTWLRSNLYVVFSSHIQLKNIKIQTFTLVNA